MWNILTEWKSNFCILLGEHFGLADLLFDQQPSLILVSNSCECILIAKEFFVQNSSLEYLKRLKKQEAPYPKLSEIQFNYKNFLKWKNFSSQTIADLSTSKKSWMSVCFFLATWWSTTNFVNKCQQTFTILKEIYFICRVCVCVCCVYFFLSLFFFIFEFAYRQKLSLFILMK